MVIVDHAAERPPPLNRQLERSAGLVVLVGWSLLARLAVLAEHYTPVHHGRLTAATLETVTFDWPHKIGFRLVRGPVPYLTEEFALAGEDGTTRLNYSGELGTDFGIAGRWWAGPVAATWEAAVRSSFTSIRTEAERRARPDSGQS